MVRYCSVSKNRQNVYINTYGVYKKKLISPSGHFNSRFITHRQYRKSTIDRIFPSASGTETKHTIQIRVYKSLRVSRSDLRCIAYQYTYIKVLSHMRKQNEDWNTCMSKFRWKWSELICVILNHISVYIDCLLTLQRKYDVHEDSHRKPTLARDGY